MVQGGMGAHSEAQDLLESFLVAGLDLAAEPKGTALAVLQCSSSGVVLQSLKLGVEDQDVLEVATSLVKLGIDCALGWPLEFANFVRDYSTANFAEQIFDGGIDWRRRLAYRETDREVQRVTGRWPLSVSTDRLGMTALRCAGLLSKMRDASQPVDRSGSGLAVEVYPAATLRIWGLHTDGYRNSSDVRQEMVAKLKASAPWLEIGGFESLMVDSCDAFDAVIAALAALSAATGHSTSAPRDKLDVAKIEGWVALPKISLTELWQELQGAQG